MGDWRPTISELTFASLPTLESQVLEVPFYEEEVFVALSSLKGDEALGLDGFTMAFWQFCWDVVIREVMGFLQNFMSLGLFKGV